MSMYRTVATLLLTPLIGSVAWGQLPAPATTPTVSSLPAVYAPLTPASTLSAPISAPPSPVGIASYPPPPGGPTLGSFLGLSYPQREYRQRRLARTPLGKLRTRIQEPLSKITGGLIPPFPPETPSLAELQAPGPVGAMAKVKLDRKAAGERIEAVRYLGTVDCHYWPEAGDALVDALRADRNEWVRLAAAETLATGCCCTKKTIMALSMVVSCSIEDGNPVEKSPQVIAAAQRALANCLARASSCETELYIPQETVPVLPSVPPVAPEIERKQGEEIEPTMFQAAWSKPAPGGQAKSGDGLSLRKTTPAQEKSYYERVDAQPWGSVIAAAKNAMLRQPVVPADARLAGYREDLEQAGVVITANIPDRSSRPANLLDMLLDDSPSMETAPVVAYALPVNRPQPTAPTVAPRHFESQEPQLAQRSEPAPHLFMTMPTEPMPKPQPKAVQLVPQPTPKPVMPRKAEPLPPTPKHALAPTPVQPNPQLMPTPIDPAPTPKPESITNPRYEGTKNAVAVQTLLSKTGNPKTIREAISELTVADLQSTPKLPLMLLRVAEAPTDTELRAACIRALGRCETQSSGIETGLQRLANERDTVIRVEATLALQDRGE